jgi:surface protein
MEAMFYGCSGLTKISIGDNWTTDSVSESSKMFFSCVSIVGGKGTSYDVNFLDKTYAHSDSGETDPGYFDFSPAYAMLYTDGTMVFQRSKITDQSKILYASFTDFENSTKVPWNNSMNLIKSVCFASKLSPISTANWFYNAFNLASFDSQNLDTSNVSDMSDMFKFCKNLTDLDVSNWNTSNVTNMSGLFDSTDITNLDVSSWDTSNVTDTSYMFSGTDIIDLDLSSWDTSNVTNMSGMFKEANIANLNISSWDTSNVTNMFYMFEYCYMLTSLDISGWNTASVTSMHCMFWGCSNLTTIYVGPGWTTNAVTSDGGMFYGCSSLVGGAGTVYDSSHTDAEYAHIDGGTDNPGYFTAAPTAAAASDDADDGEAAETTTLPAKASRITTTYSSSTAGIVGYSTQ